MGRPRPGPTPGSLPHAAAQGLHRQIVSTETMRVLDQDPMPDVAARAGAARPGRRALTPAIVLGAETAALGVVRALGRHGVPVVVLHYGSTDTAHRSRYVNARARITPPHENEAGFVADVIASVQRYGGGGARSPPPETRGGAGPTPPPPAPRGPAAG